MTKVFSNFRVHRIFGFNFEVSFGFESTFADWNSGYVAVFKNPMLLLYSFSFIYQGDCYKTG